MRYEENQCVSCDLPCIGEGCSYRHVLYVDCDTCGEPASVVINGRDLCLDCAKEELVEAANDTSVDDLAKMLGIEMIYINT